MLLVTSLVQVAAWATLRTISCVAAPCSSTAAAIEVATESISRMRAVIPPIAETAWPVTPWICPICWLISSVALAVCAASSFTSDATTAKPRPASPARAASMVALSASRLVCPAMFEISPTMSPMRVAAWLRSWTRFWVWSASPTAA